MIINDLDDYYIVFDTKNRNTELDALETNSYTTHTVVNGLKLPSLTVEINSQRRETDIRQNALPIPV